MARELPLRISYGFLSRSWFRGAFPCQLLGGLPYPLRGRWPAPGPQMGKLPSWRAGLPWAGAGAWALAGWLGLWLGLILGLILVGFGLDGLIPG